jgi:uracil-DNA glycosylase family protein
VSSLESVRAEAADCQRCPLWQIGTQTVFGEGPPGARVLFLGEAPGAQEDLAGRPFVGPAGKMFDEGLAQAGIDRASVYVTNTVKHRPWIQVGSRGKNRPPKTSEVKACRVWLDAELALVRPTIVCCLGAVAAKAILGPQFKLLAGRGQWHTSPLAANVLATVHPSFVMVQPADSAQRWRETFFADLRAVADRMARPAGERDLARTA